MDQRGNDGVEHHPVHHPAIAAERVGGVDGQVLGQRDRELCPDAVE